MTVVMFECPDCKKEVMATKVEDKIQCWKCDKVFIGEFDVKVSSANKCIL